MAAVQQSLRNIRIVHFAFLAAPALLFFAIAWIAPAAKAEPPFLPYVLAILAVSEVGIATAFRATLIDPAVERLQRSAQDAMALEQWQRGNLLSFSFALTVVLYGVVIRVMGFPWSVAGWFFMAGFSLLLWWTPRLEIPISTGAPPPQIS